jgi:hypothetical protein
MARERFEKGGAVVDQFPEEFGGSREHQHPLGGRMNIVRYLEAPLSILYGHL